MAGERIARAVSLVGCTVNTSCVPLPGATSNAAEVATGRPVAAAVSVYPVPALLTLRSVNVATPATADRVRVPESVPPPGLAPSATVTPPVKPAAVFPN